MSGQHWCVRRRRTPRRRDAAGRHRGRGEWGAGGRARGTAAAGRGWPSPRTWEMAARLMAAGNAARASQDARSALIRGAVGDGAGIEFLAWLVEMDLPDPEVVLADP